MWVIVLFCRLRMRGLTCPELLLVVNNSYLRYKSSCLTLKKQARSLSQSLSILVSHLSYFTHYLGWWWNVRRMYVHLEISATRVKAIATRRRPRPTMPMPKCLL